MRTYEALVIFPSQVAGDLHQDAKNLFEEAVKKCEGKILNRTELGKRPLGYPIKKATEGYFVSFAFELLPDKMGPLRQSLQLVEGILKFTMIQKPKIELPRLSKPVSARPVPIGEKRQRGS